MRVLILEDSQERIDQFQKNLEGHEVIITDKPKYAIKLLETENKFDILCLDHDMGMVFEQPGEGTGYELAEWVSRHPEVKPKKILIHSMNNIGAAAMMHVLGDAGMKATYIPLLWTKIRG